MPNETVLAYLLTDGQETWLFEEWESALEHLRQAFLDDTWHPPRDGDEYHLELKRMTRAEIDALPVH